MKFENFYKEKRERSLNVNGYFKSLDLSKEMLEDKKILDIGCWDGEFLKYLIDNKITDNVYGLDIDNGSNIKGEEYEILIDSGRFLHQSFVEDIKIKNIQLILFKSSFYPPLIKNSVNIFKRLVKKNLSEDGEIRVQIKLEKDNKTLLSVEWEKVLEKIHESGLKYDIDFDKELLIIKKINKIWN